MGERNLLVKSHIPGENIHGETFYFGDGTVGTLILSLTRVARPLLLLRSNFSMFR